MIGKTEYRGCTIEVLDNLRLLVKFDEQEQQAFETGAAAREAIDNRVRAADKARAHALQLAAITSGGERFNITGIHLGTQALLGLPKESAAHGVYPDVPGVANAVAEMVQHQRHVKLLDDWLRPFSIRPSRGYGRVGAGELVGKITELEQEYAEKKSAAAAAAPTGRRPLVKS